MTRMTGTSGKIETNVNDEVLYILTWMKDGNYRLEIPHTGEIREAKEFQHLLRSLCKDEGFYLRRI